MSQKKKEEEINYEEIALALANDLVEMSRSVRLVLANSHFSYGIMDEVKLLAHTTEEVLQTYTVTEEKSEKEELEESN